MIPRTSRRLAGVIAACAVMWPSSRLAGATQASPYVPASDWSMPLVEHLIRAGVMTDPSPLTRPLRRSDIADALHRIDTTAVSASVRQTIRTILEAYRTVNNGPQYWARVYAGVDAATHGRRNPLREGGDGATTGHFGVRAQATFGPLAVSSHGFADGRLRFDPDYTGNRDKSPTHRFTDAYVSVQTQYARVFFGAIDRNWGPSGIPGTLVSAEPYSYDHIMLELGTNRLRFEALVTDLDPFRGPNGQRVNRYWVTHRVLFRPWDWIVGVFSQATLWTGGSRGFELRWMNPFKLSRSTDIDEPIPADSVNSVFGAELWLRGPRGITLQGAFTVDDFGFQFGSVAPDRLAGTTVIDAPIGHTAVRGSFTFVSSLAYRTSNSVETIMRRGIGLGRNYSDYTEAALQWSILAVADVVVVPEIVLLRQGEGDFRDPFPPTPASDHPFIFEGVIERTLRLGVRTRIAPSRYFDAEGHVGVHVIDNDAHVLGASRTEAVAGLRISVRLDGPVSLR